MKSRTTWNCVALAVAIAAVWLSGCGSSNSATNAVTVTVTSSVGTVIIVGQSTTLTATVVGGTSTNTSVNWQPCQFTTTTVSGTTTTTSTPATCPTDGTLGALSNQQTTGTATYTAPGKIPDQTKFPGLQIVITAQSQQDTKKTGSVKLILDSGIGVSLTPITATVPTNELQTFNVVLTNDLQSQGVTWLVTQSTATATISEPNLATCSPTCGTITSNTPTTATYTAPATVPTASTPSGASTTPANLTVVATAKSDNTRFATGTITIIQGGPITFSGISPTIAPQGGALWDIYLNAPNISSASQITITDQNGGFKTFTSSSGQVKVIFPVPASTSTTPSASSGARLRLFESDLAGATSPGSTTPLTYTVSVTDPGEPVTQTPGGQFTFTLLPVRPTVVASSPNGVVQGASTSEFPLEIDGGYFGPRGTFASASFQGNTIPQSTSSNSRRLALAFPTSAIGPPGLYPLSVSRTPALLPTSNNGAAVTTVAVFPDYSGGPPAAPTGPGIPAGTNPSAIDIDPTLGVVVVAETGSNTVEFFNIGNGTLTSLGAFPVGQIPTGVSVNPTNHSVAVVNYGSQSVSILPIPVPGASTVTPATIDISGALQGQVSPAPRPYAIGVDPDTNLALVAYSSTSTSSFANLGFVVNLNQGTGAPFGCLGNSGTPPCIFSQVTLNTGAYPQIAMAPHGHMAYVTPGGSGVVSGVNVMQPSTSITLGTLTLTAGTVTATTANSTPLTGLVPGIPTTVLISGVPPLSNPGGNPTTVNLNGVFLITVTSSTSFTYFLGPNVTGSGTTNGGTVFFGSPNLIFGGIPSTSQGIAINPISHTAALANADATSQQINLLNQLDQSFTSISFQLGCTAFTVPCTGGIELPLSTVGVAWQPYTNSIVSYNPDLQHPCSANSAQVCTGIVSISDPITRQRYAIVPVNGPSNATLTVQNGTTGSLRLWGGIAVDAVTNQAFVVESGSTTSGSTSAGRIEIVNLGALGTTSTTALASPQITEVIVPSPPNSGAGVIGGIPNALVPQATLTSANDLPGVQIFGSGFAPGVSQVRLDGTFIPSGNVLVDPNSTRKITVAIPGSFLSLPHRYALDVVNGSVPSTTNTSNAVDFIVIKAVDMTAACATPTPSSVAIADQLANGPFSPIALVTNSGCNSLSTIDINPVPGSTTFGTVLRSLPIGATPQGVAISSHLGMAVVANNAAGTASIVDLVNNKEAVADVQVGSSPTGVAINEATGVALVANFGSNTVSQINLGLLFGSSPPTSLTATPITGIQAPVAVAIDPDRGTNNQGLAVVTGIPLSSSSPAGTLYPVDIGLASPSLSTTVSVGSVSSSPTGIVFNPAVATGTANPGLFYVNSSGSNQISAFNPDTGIASPTSVGINPTALAVNPQSGAILTSNFAGKSASIVDTVSSPIKTVQTLGLPGSAQFGVAIDQFTNLGVIVDQANNRVLLFPMPN